MFKNKDGSYNKFQLIIIFIILSIIISITGIYISENITLPEIEFPTISIPSPTLTPIPTITTSIIIPTTTSNISYYTNTGNTNSTLNVSDNQTNITTQLIPIINPYNNIMFYIIPFIIAIFLFFRDRQVSYIFIAVLCSFICIFTFNSWLLAGICILIAFLDH